MKSTGKVVTTYPLSTAKRKEMIPIRLDVHTGWFLAVLDGVTLQDTVLLSLIDQLQFHAERLDIDMEPYIHVRSLDLGPSNITFNYELLMCSGVSPGGTRFIKRAALTETGEVVAKDELAREWGVSGVLIPYSRERVATIIGLVAEFSSFKSKLANLCSDPEAFLDNNWNASTTRLLESK